MRRETSRSCFPRATLGVLLAAPSLFQGFYASYGAKADPSRGIIEINATDCHWIPAPLVTARADFADGGANLAYFINDTLTPSATATDPGGYAVLLNAPALTPVTLSVTPLALGRVANTVMLFARPGSLSLMYVGAH
jgi:hypothetical protein